jgi:predicted phage terminase large subunit-like protein
MTAFTRAEAERLLSNLKNMSTKDMLETLTLLEEIEKRKRITLCQNDFLAFIAHVDAHYKFGTHLKRLGGLLMCIEDGSKDRIAVSMGPRFGKSQMISIYFPAWYLGRNPDHKLILASHTSDLAVDMARKVRNLMQSDLYKEIFPGVNIAADAKAAGKWNTTKGGEVFAIGVGGALAGRGAHLCADPETVVWTKERGAVTAGTVRVGEHLRSWHGWAEVKVRIAAYHAATVTVADKLQVSREHPIWTFNRGWVPAASLHAGDVLWTMTLFDIIKTRLSRSVYDLLNPRNVADPDLQYLGYGNAALHKPKSSKLYILRRGWNNVLRALDELCGVFRGYGTPTNAQAYAGSYRQQQGIQPRELPLGGRRHTAEQPRQRKEDHGIWRDTQCHAVGSANWDDQRYGSSSGVCNGDVAGRGAYQTPYESYQESRYSEITGWWRNLAARFLSRCGSILVPGELRDHQEGYLAVLKRKSQNILGFLLGVRFAGPITVKHHGPKEFVNFTVGGDHTFIGDNVLSHNCIVDDPLSEQDVKAGNTASLDVVYEWFRAGLRTRLMPGGRLAILHTRWHQRDLIGRLTKDAAMNPDADQYEIFEFPAILTSPNPNYDPDDPDSTAEIQKSLWPEQWSLESLLRTKASMPAWQWNAQYQQTPTAQEAAIIKKDNIKWWTQQDPPAVDYTVQAWDTALTTKERSDYSVCQTWGVWKNEDGVDNVILLNCVRGKYEFPELKRVALQQVKDWNPDTVIVETKASGQPLVDEMRRSGIYVQEFSPGKGQDKIARVNAISDMFTSGQVWFPETWWASEVVDELLAFPAGEHDDMVDACSLALHRIRKGGLLRLASDNVDDDDYVAPRRGYY